MKTIQFTKMHGLGNDFVVINAVDQQIDVNKLPIQALGNRFFGIGFDQLLIIEKGKNADFFCRIFNSDGSEAEQCGNGLRCVARLIHEDKLHTANTFTIATIAGIYPVWVEDYNHITVTMGAPDVKENLMPLMLTQSLQEIPVSVLSIGNPHAVTKVESVELIPEALGAEISTHTYFPNGTNVGFMQIINPAHIRLRTYERGSGETFACGSNACAAAIVGMVNGWLKSKVEVEFRLGSLMIEWPGGNAPVQMTGPATRVFDGVIE